ncbi:DUF423 domain-containing protein [Aequorivita lipolytica]|uniref:DUF423 domain-containing protein n=1 Tax=Aequorivita lipolytica TaxID=153267 RepID=A0A5C6YPA9_9FLAO|nr:DUF423 domain-containing protein [Aequorivita lipolytica]TXD69299.1 DUF423 domain-containing protein [Aequorivita lipolytica]SRX50079.1 hypothetical protein AEQU2_00545 [Aequorivita lipolytica]
MTVFDKNMVTTASFLTAVTIAIGAFGAHGLKNIVDASALITFETGVRYQMYHCLGILVLGMAPLISEKIKKTVFWLFIAGIILFSGSIYLLALNAVLPFNSAKIGFITPIGGFLFIIGWIWLAYSLLSLKKQ